MCCSLRLASSWWNILLICVLNCQVYTLAHLERPKNVSVAYLNSLVHGMYNNFTGKMNSTEVQNPWRKLDVFSSVLALCKVCSHVSEALILALQTLSLSFVTNNSSSDSKVFLRFIAFSGSPTAVHHVMQIHGHSYKLTASHALRYCTVGIPFWTYSHKRLSLTEKPQYHIRW